MSSITVSDGIDYMSELKTDGNILPLHHRQSTVNNYPNTPTSSFPLSDHDGKWRSLYRTRSNSLATKLEERSISKPAPAPVFRQFGVATPLGLACTALTLLVDGMITVKTHGVNTPNIIVALGAVYGGFAQIFAGCWEFASGNTFAGTAFVSYGSFWISYALIRSPWSGIEAAYATSKEFNDAIGIYYFAWFILTFILTLACLRSSVGLVGILASLTLCFLFLAIGQIIPEHPRIYEAGGWFGIVCSGFCWYVVAAGLITTETSYFNIPVGNLAKED